MDLEYYTGQRIFLGFLGEYEPDGLVAGEPCGGCGWKEAQRGLWNQVRAQLLIGFGEIFTLL